MSQLELIRLRQRRPGLLDRVRSYWLGPWSSKDKALAQHFGGGRTMTGISVSEESALTYSPIWSGVMMAADDIASLPLNLYRRLQNGGKEKYDSHPLHRLIHDEPNPEMDSIVWRRTMQIHVMLWQNAYAEIERDMAGRPVALWPLVPESVQPYRELPMSPLRYRVYTPSGRTVEIPPSDMLHLVGYSHDGSVGSSLAVKARESIGLGLAAERFGGAFFGNGATVGGVVSFKGSRPPEMSDKGYKDQFEARHQGLDRAFRLLALYNEAKYTQTSVNPNEGQFNETRVFQIREAARWLRMPPHKLGDLADATYSNVEQMDAAYFGSCIRPWLALWNQQLNRKLIARLERNIQFIEHDTHGFLSVDAQARGELHTAEFNVGAVTPNDIRGYENRNPVTGGDEAFIPLNVMPLSKVGRWWDLQIAEKQAQIDKLNAPPPPPAPPAEPQMQQQMSAEIGTLRAHLESARLQIDDGRAEQLRLRALLDGAQQLLSEMEARSANPADATTPKFGVGDRVVALVNHEEGMKGMAGAVAEANAGAPPYYAINFDAPMDDGNPHKWLSEDELDAEEAVTGMRAQVEALTTERDHVRETLKKATAEWTTERDDLARRLAASKEDRQRDAAQHEEALSHWRAQVEHLTKEAEDIKAERDEASKGWHEEIDNFSDHRNAWLEKGKALEQERDGAQAETVKARAEAERLTGDLAAAKAESAQAWASLGTLGQERDALIERGQRDVESVRVAEAAREAAIQRAEAAERDKAIAEQAQASANAAREAATTAHAQQLTRMVAAARALIVEALGRIVRRETEKARRNQATPEKLRHWAQTFYVLHEETSIEMLQPAIRAHLAVLGSDDQAADVTSVVVKAHIVESLRQIDAVAATEPSEFQAALGKMLNRWETQRPDALADRLLREGVDHVRTQQ